MSNTSADLKLIINNITVSYTDDGLKNARTIIFIHGFPFNKSMWTVQVSTLQENFRVITYDVRGHGESDIGNVDFSIELFVDDLVGLMDSLNIEKTLLCGLSLGGYIALRAIEKYPDRIQALILSDTQCIADSPEAVEKRMSTIDGINANGVQQYAETSIANLFAPESHKAKQKEITAIRNTILSTPKETLIKTLKALAARKETCTSLNKINVPVLIIVGREDKITPIAAARFMNEKIKHSIIMIVDHAGHLTNLENPSDFNDQLKKFVYPFSEKDHFA